ncbi:hypothetical protein Plhal304r1_c026g0086621 [Plasmopara halstedii]
MSASALGALRLHCSPCRKATGENMNPFDYFSFIDPSYASRFDIVSTSYRLHAEGTANKLRQCALLWRALYQVL